ncbi:ricin B lectin domain-containing protein [Blyttiomyces helicus]|uniref:Ricin B lectin domain-containing protein n=1 Tax=Blyttiomyces helicus TaxID=388810 RepID=A0A4P9W906_9FUNG|nr:ricin B lectin domain-containing protein [Blyttiomyces helicus]|eukprot:RKO89021.1 ricin B lectin domain-containing protein [Blyttiomyces helicus]
MESITIYIIGGVFALVAIAIIVYYFVVVKSSVSSESEAPLLSTESIPETETAKKIADAKAETATPAPAAEIPSSFIFHNASSKGMCINEPGSSTTNYYPLNVATCNNQTNQQFMFKNGSLVNTNSGLCLDIEKAGATSGTAVGQYACASTPVNNQQWKYDSVKNRLTSPLSSTMCLDIDSSGNLQMATCDGKASQEWFSSASPFVPLNQLIKNAISNNMCMEVPSFAKIPTYPLTVATCNNNSNQQFSLTNGTLVNANSGKCLDIYGASSASGSQVGQDTCTSGKQNQQSIHDDSNYMITSPNSPNLCLGLGDNNALEMTACNDKPNQQWFL